MLNMLKVRPSPRFFSSRQILGIESMSNLWGWVEPISISVLAHGVKNALTVRTCSPSECICCASPPGKKQHWKQWTAHLWFFRPLIFWMSGESFWPTGTKKSNNSYRTTSECSKFPSQVKTVCHQILKELRQTKPNIWEDSAAWEHHQNTTSQIYKNPFNTKGQISRGNTHLRMLFMWRRCFGGNCSCKTKGSKYRAHSPDKKNDKNNHAKFQ